MARIASIGRLALAAVLLTGTGLPVTGQRVLTLEQASSRKPPNFVPTYQGERVSVQGIAASRAVSLGAFYHLIIENEEKQGLTLEGGEGTFTGIEPGDILEVDGTLTHRAGLPVLQPYNVKKVGQTSPPPARKVSLTNVNSFEPLGTLVLIEGTVITAAESAGGDLLEMSQPGEPSIRVFLSSKARGSDPGLKRFKPGDRVSVIGISSQNCPVPPFDHSFQVNVRDASAVTIVQRNWIVSPDMLFAGLLTLAGAFAIWWLRERTMAAQRWRLREMTALAEDVISAENPGELARKLVSEAPRLFQATGIDLYLLNRSLQTLDRVPTAQSPEPFSVNVSTPAGIMGHAVALCFRNRTLLHVPDTRRHPSPGAVPEPDLPRAMLLVPMFAHNDLLGVMAVRYERKVRRTKEDDQMAVQHLGNQIATALRLQEQRSMREQILRSEKMAAAGQLISGVANELRGPLNAIHRLAEQMQNRRLNPLAETELREIEFEARRGDEIVGRLVSYAKPEEKEIKPVDVIAVLNSLAEFRNREWDQKSIHVRMALPHASWLVLCDQSEIEQAFLNLLVHAEQSIANQTDRHLTIGGRTQGKHALIFFDYTSYESENGDGLAENGNGHALGLHVVRAIIQSHGGEFRSLHGLPTGARFEVLLPLHQYTQSPPVTPSDIHSQRPPRILTILLVEPDTASQRKLSGIFANRGHRVIPVTSAEQATDMAQRLRFDVVFCAVRLPGLSWVEMFERIRRQIGAFVLLAEGHDSELARAFKGSEGYLLNKPIDEADAVKLLASIEFRQEPVGRR
jgi:signal transduction histidine kinase/CheY-like chemotaxis protein